MADGQEEREFEREEHYERDIDDMDVSLQLADEANDLCLLHGCDLHPVTRHCRRCGEEFSCTI